MTAQDVGTEAQRESGKKLYLKYCSQCHGEKGDGEGYATPHLYPQAPQLHDGQVQGPDDSQRSAPDPSGPRQHHQARHALHVDARLANTLRPGSVESRLLHHDLLPRFLEPRKRSASRCRSRARRAATKESIELGKKLYADTGCVKCHGNLGRGDGPSAPTLVDDLGHPIRAADLAQSWTFRGGSSREDIFRTMSTGLNGTPMPSFVDASDARATMGDHRLHRLSLGERRACLYQPRRRQARPGSDRSEEWSRELRTPRLSPAFRSSGRSWSPDARSIRPRPASPFRRSTMPSHIALLVRWHDMSAEKTGKNGPSLPVPPEEEEGVGAQRRCASRRSQRSPFGDAEVTRRPAQETPQQDPFAEAQQRQPPAHPSSPTRSRSRFLRRCRRAPASPTSSSATPRTRWISGSSIWPAPIPFSSPAREARTSRPTTRGISPASRATTRENGRSSSSGPFAQARAPRSRPESSCRSPSRSGTGSRASVATGEVSRSGTLSTSSQKWSHRPSARWCRTALVILVIELAVIGWVRRRYGSRARTELGGEPSATGNHESVSRRKRSGGSDVQEHLRSRR